MAALVTKAKPASIQTPSAFITRNVYRFADPTGWTGDQWRLIAREPINRMAKQFIIREIVSLPFILTSGDKDDKRPDKYAERWDEVFELDGGFDLWLTRMIDDACIVPFGGASEVGYKGDDLDWVVHVDGATLIPTYEDKTPYMQVNPDNWEQRVYFKKGQLVRLLIYARPDIRYKEYQISPTEASFLEIEALSKIYLYYLQQLSDTPPPGILDVMDMSAADAAIWAEHFRELLEGTDPIKVPLLTDHTIPAKFIPFGRSPQDLNVIEQFKRFAEMLLAKYGLSIGDLRLFEHESTKAGERVSQVVTERSGIGYWASKFERFLGGILPKGLSFEFKQPRPAQELVVAQRKQVQLSTLQALTGNKPLIDVKDAVEEALALELFQTEVSPAKEEEPPPMVQATDGAGRPLQQQPENGKKPQEVLDEEADRDLSKSVAEIVAKALGTFDPKGPGSIRFTKLWRKIFEHIGKGATVSFGAELTGLAAEWDAAKAAEEQKADVDLDKTIERMLEANDWWLVPTAYDDELGNLLEEMYLNGFDKAALDIEKLRGGTGGGLGIAWDVNDPRVIDFVERHGAEMVQNVNNGTKFYLREMIKGMLEEGYPGPAEAVKRIRYDIFGLEPGEASKFTDNRIRSIVNYETNRAMSHAGHELRASLGLKNKQWFTSSMNPCDICLANQAQGVVKADFQYDGVFGAILYPPAHPQTCRCVATAVESEVRALGSEPIVWPYTAANKALIEKAPLTHVVEGRLHEAFTVALDRAFQLGYLDRDARITASNVIGNWLPEISAELKERVAGVEADVSDDDLRLLAKSFQDFEKGGAGSGNFGHSGRPGKRGGSAGRSGVQAAQSALAGYKSRNEVVGALGLRNTVHLNQMIKHGMPSVKKGNRRYVKWPEAETWFNAYTGAGKGKAGITAANKAVGGGAKPPAVPNPPKPPSKPVPTGGQEVSVKAGGMNSDTSHIKSHGVGGSGTAGIVSKAVDKNVRKTLATLPQEHVDAVKRLHYQTDSMADRYVGQRSGWAKNVGGYHTGYGEVALLYADTTMRGKKRGYKKWDKTTVVHEAGHAVEKAIKLRHYGPVDAGILGATKTRARSKHLQGKVTVLYNQVKDKGLGGRGPRAVSTYAKKNKWENFCESYSAYVLKPKTLKRANGAMYDFLRDDIFNGVEYTK